MVDKLERVLRVEPVSFGPPASEGQGKVGGWSAVLKLWTLLANNPGDHLSNKLRAIVT